MIKFGQKLKSTDEVNYYITSDLHLFHKNVLKFCPETRPFETVDQMNESIISEINKTCSVNDLIFHLGDFSFGNKEKTENVIAQLNPTIVFILGNHDLVIRNNISCNSFDYLEIKYNSHFICMSHYPFACWNRGHYDSLMMYGHVHGSYDLHGKSLDVGWDKHGRLLTLDEAVAMCDSKDKYTPDNH